MTSERRSLALFSRATRLAVCLMLAGIVPFVVTAESLGSGSEVQRPAQQLPGPWGTFTGSPARDEAIGPEVEADAILDVTDLEQLAAVLRLRDETIPTLYATLLAGQRADLVMALNAAGELGDVFAELLLWEPRTEIRALLIECIDPADFAAPEVAAGDPELVAVLELPTATPIGVAEWVARMELASRIDPAIGAEWVSGARRAFPESPQVAFTAAVVTLADGAGGQVYSDDERERAAERLAELLLGESARLWSAESRMRAYYALYFSPKPASAGSFFRARLAMEPDPRAREILETLETRLLVQATPLP